MPDQKTGSFEQKIVRLEEIVKELEGGNVELDRAVALFKEGKNLSGECEDLLKGAQAQIDRAMESPTPQSAPPQAFNDEDIPF